MVGAATRDELETDYLDADEIKLLRLIAEGLEGPDIIAQLCMSPILTRKTALILRTLGVTRPVHAVAKAARLGPI